MVSSFCRSSMGPSLCGITTASGVPVFWPDFRQRSPRTCQDCPLPDSRHLSIDRVACRLHSTEHAGCSSSCPWNVPGRPSTATRPAQRVAYQLSEVIAIYPITPSPRWRSRPMPGRRRARRTSGARCPPSSRCSARRGAAGAVHGALQAGALATTFTASPGAAADDPEHVQDRRRADAGGLPRGGARGRHPCAVDLRRPQRRDGRPRHRLRAAASASVQEAQDLALDRARRDARGARAVPALLRRLPHVARGREDRDARRRRPSAR